MSTQPAMPLSSTALPAYPRASTNRKMSISGLSMTGGLLFLVSFLVIGSAYMSLRPEVMGLALHPYLVPLAFAFPLVLLARIMEFPVRVLAALLVFTFMYCFSVLNGSGLPLGEIFKIVSAVVTIVTCALLVRRRGDFVAGALGLSIALAFLAWTGLQEDTTTGVEAMDSGNKNAYSLYALPTLLLAGYVSTRMKTVPIPIKAILLACVLPILAAIFMSANRSGYLGAVVIGFMLFWDRRGRGMFVVAAVAGAVVIWISNYGDTKVFDERMKQTVEGTESDDLRIAILKTCMAITLENPIIGISPDELTKEIGRRTSVDGLHHSFLDSHNVFAHVAAGSGLICLAALLAVGFMLWTLKPADGRKYTGRDDPARQALSLVRMMVVVWVVRGVFTREILYNPACNIAIGLCIGMYILAQSVPADAKKAKQKSSPSPSPPGHPLAVPTA